MHVNMSFVFQVFFQKNLLWTFYFIYLPLDGKIKELQFIPDEVIFFKDEYNKSTVFIKSGLLKNFIQQLTEKNISKSLSGKGNRLRLITQY